ncbi:MAG: hypothetical protein QNJ40_07810 [Xanthomonadales bacterium]|nr:hypothetical protein [Xanthomonadales bacterium]
MRIRRHNCVAILGQRDCSPDFRQQGIKARQLNADFAFGNWMLVLNVVVGRECLTKQQ